MRKMVMVTVAMMCWAVVLPTNAQDNFVRLRNIYDIDKHESQQYILFENNSSPLFAVGSKLIMGKDGFFNLNPFAYYKFQKDQWRLEGWQIGARYNHDSLGTDSVGPSVRHIRKLWNNIGLYSELTQYLDTDKDRHKIDASISLTTLNLGWYVGMEFWYFHTFNEAHNFYPRPIRLGYRFSDRFGISAMYELRRNNRGFRGNAGYVDMEFRF